MRRTVVSLVVLLLQLGSERAVAQSFYGVATAGLGDTLTCIGISHRDPNFVMIGTSMGKIHRTTDGGATWQEVIVVPHRELFYGVERSGDPGHEYALGLPGKSPHLQSWLRRQGLHTAGHNLQELLVMQGDRPTAVNWIEVDWHNENRIFVGTTDGLYRSTNKGRTFLRLWQGRSSSRERVVNSVVTDPAEPNRLLIGTAGGLFVSTDAGTTFRREFNFYIYGSYVRALYFDEEYAGLVHMALGGAAMASPDSGRNWITTHWDLWAPRSSVQWISLGPNNIRLMGTRDGLYASWQGGEMGTWVRRGYKFANVTITMTLATAYPQLWYMLTDQAVWRTVDSGATWVKVKQTGGREYPVWISAFRGDPAQMWLITNGQVYRTGPIPKLTPAATAKKQPELLDIPDLHEFWREVVRHKHVYFDDLQKYRERAPWAALVPTITAGGIWETVRETSSVRAFPYLHLPFTFFTQLPDRALTFEVFAMWDLSRLLFDRREMPYFGRVDRTLRTIREDLTDRVLRLYGEYRRVATRLAFSPPADPLAYEGQRIRLQEIAGFFDAVSDGYWTKHTGGNI